MYSFYWKGKIIGKNKKAKTNRKGIYYNSTEYSNFKEELKYSIIAQKKCQTMTNETIVSISFTISRARDIDSSLSAVLDALQAAKVIKNDNKIMSLNVRKYIKKSKCLDEIFVCVKEIEK
jgi:Holliday junction resolvase RusA-like endonuclease